MKKLPFAIIGAASMALAACGGQNDDTVGDAVEDQYENAADQVDNMADNATGAEAEALEDQADALREEGEAKEDAIDDADIKVSDETAANVQGM